MRNLLKDKNYVPFGSQYYRAPSPHKEDWDRDLKRMSELGFNTVKYWIQWRWNNPDEGEYYFDDIDELMDLAQKYSLKVMLNTIFDVAPAWIYKKYSEASMVTLSGRKIGPQSQPHRQIGGLGYCFNHDGVMEHFFEFLKVSVDRYKDHPALEIWNVGSEPELTSSMAEMRDYANDLSKIVEQLREELPDLGEVLAMDGKALHSAARRAPKEGKEADGRRDSDADRGVKSYWVDDGANGNPWKKIKSWFGYKLHLIVDANYELPVAFEVTKASRSEIPEGKKLVKELKEKHPGIVARCEYLAADKGLDDTELNVQLWDDHSIKPLIDIRNCWKDGEQTRRVEHTSNVVYDYQGTVSCYDMRLGHRKQMAYGGFEAERGTLKYRCPAEHYGCKCHWKSQCEIKGAVRIKLDEDRRVFTPLARSSYKWRDLYKKRSSG